MKKNQVYLIELFLLTLLISIQVEAHSFNIKKSIYTRNTINSKEVKKHIDKHLNSLSLNLNTFLTTNLNCNKTVANVADFDVDNTPKWKFSMVGKCPGVNDIILRDFNSACGKGVSFSVVRPKGIDVYYIANQTLYTQLWDARPHVLNRLRKKINLITKKIFKCQNVWNTVDFVDDDSYLDDIIILFSGICPGFTKLNISNVTSEKVTFEWETFFKKGTKTF